MFHRLVEQIFESAQKDFKKASEEIRLFVDTMPREDFILTVKEIGTIPESIEHDSTEEKLYSKASDITYGLSVYWISSPKADTAK